ncbi:hypothetical protein THOG11_30239 [Vibrio harveyi]|nr:hypothetical protein TH15OA1_480386 [Vibrio harveyi]CAH1572132.1 hypothetical protein THOG11_30239 [Vibrio harveyi]CAH1585597.1 hypothetical protein THOD03_90119 [Vibrio harveyi]
MRTLFLSFAILTKRLFCLDKPYNKKGKIILPFPIITKSF